MTFTGDGDLERAIEQSRALADLARPPDNLSQNAREAIKDSIDEYVRALTQESYRASKRRGSDIISKADVDQVTEYLFHGQQGMVVRHMGTAGGVILGAGLSNIPVLFSGDKIASSTVLLTLVLSLVGLTLVVFHVARTTR